MPLIQTEHAEIEYLDDGPSDGRPVVLLHGFPDVAATWDDVVAFLPEGCRIIRPTLRGVGRSRVTDPAARSAQVAALATDVLHLTAALDLEPFVLVGHDWGARAAHAVAVLEPGRVTGLVTLSTAYGPGAGLTEDEKLDDAAVAWYRYWLCTSVGADAFRRDPAALVRWAWAKWSPGLAVSSAQLDAVLGSIENDQFADDVVHYYRHGIGEAPGSPVYEASQRVLDGWPVIDVPATFLIGTDDGCETLAPARTNAGLFAQGRELVELAGAGHFLTRERPREVADSVLSHLD
ncbi:alpha/beta hydrolase [Conyzicola nivalis]|uniref:Alpha/beta hydrolase n=1 Tax=Conyzicola nivalis TaxID=1477021 RepID=A0A916WN12_9MICO|nr:alpha/beta hydrolase [Conyzicola nivalis]GGB13414.1 alpha/beta hydrolase [Conyzicola nivalis]